MRNLFVLILLFQIIVIDPSIHAQLKGNITGDVMTNLNFYMRNTNINASNTPLYDNTLTGGEGWLSLRYSQPGFNASLRFDAFHNSNLFNPSMPLNLQGIGMWNLQKEIDNLTLTAGYIYDQIGSGLLFRTYEDRGLLIDNALVGLHGKYKINSHLTLKAFTGKQKFLGNQVINPIIKGINAEGDFDLNDNMHITPGIGILNRTLDQETMNLQVADINSFSNDSLKFIPKYNMYAYTFYNTLSFKNLTWYAEYAFKSKEGIRDLNGELINANGKCFYTTLGYSGAGWGINGSLKATDNFVMRTSPYENLANQGLLNWHPVIAKLRSQRLISRYTPAALMNSEMAWNIDAFFTNKADNLNVSGSYTKITDLPGTTKMYQEIFGEVENRKIENWIFTLGVQRLFYNQSVYQSKSKIEYPDVQSTTVFAEIVRKLGKGKSIRGEVQFMDNKMDYGSWIYLLGEYNLAPRWSFALADMYNFRPSIHVINKKANHYPNVFVAFTHKNSRFTAQYVKQVDGINCTGGVCRFEPAFSGVKVGMTTNF